MNCKNCCCNYCKVEECVIRNSCDNKSSFRLTCECYEGTPMRYENCKKCLCRTCTERLICMCDINGECESGYNYISKCKGYRRVNNAN